MCLKKKARKAGISPTKVWCQEQSAPSFVQAWALWWYPQMNPKIQVVCHWVCSFSVLPWQSLSLSIYVYMSLSLSLYIYICLYIYTHVYTHVYTLYIPKKRMSGCWRIDLSRGHTPFFISGFNNFGFKAGRWPNHDPNWAWRFPKAWGYPQIHFSRIFDCINHY